MTKIEIFHSSLMTALTHFEVKREMFGLEYDIKEDGICIMGYQLRDVLFNMIRIEVEEYIYEHFFRENPRGFDKWCDNIAPYMYDDLWKWIDAGLLFGCEDDILPFSAVEWNKADN